MSVCIVNITLRISCHVKAHSGHPWNEFVDSVAKATAGNNCKSLLPAPLVDSVVDSPFCGWSSIAHHYIRDLAYPPVVDGASQVLSSEVASQLNIVDQERCIAGGKNAKSQSTVSICFTIALHIRIHNLSSAVDKTESLLHLEKLSIHASSLQEQHHEANLLVIALQETREERQASVSTNCYMIAPGHEQNNYSCELWSSLVLPDASCECEDVSIPDIFLWCTAAHAPW